MKVRRLLKIIWLGILWAGVCGCPEEGNTIHFLIIDSGDPSAQQRWLEGRKADFLKETGVTVNYDIVSWGDSFTRVERALKTGESDVIQLRSTWNAHFAAPGGLKELAWRDFGGREAFAPALPASAEYQGRCFGVPWIAETAVLFYNENTFKEAGVTAPGTLEELIGVGRKITAKKGKGSALALPGINSSDLVDNWSAFFHQFGGEYLSRDGKTVGVGSEAGVSAVQQYLDFFIQGLADKGGIEFSKTDTEGRFFKGRAALCWLYPRGAQRLSLSAPELKAGIAFPLPHSAVVGSNLAIPEKSRHRQKATRWINYLLREDNLTAYSREIVVMLSARQTVLTGPAFNDGSWPEFRRALAQARPYPAASGWLKIEGETSAALKLIMIAYRHGKYRPEMVAPILEKAARAAER